MNTQLPQTDRLIIGVMGAYHCDIVTYDLARQVGKLIAERNAVLLTGGRKGVMEGASRGAHEAGGLTIGILKGESREEKPNPYVQVAIRTGFGEGRNVINIAAADAIIAISGSFGTLSEIALAMKMNKPVVLLESWDLEKAGPTGNIDVVTAQTPEEAVNKVFDLLPKSLN